VGLEPRRLLPEGLQIGDPESSGPPATCRAGPRRPLGCRSATHRSLPSQGIWGRTQLSQASWRPSGLGVGRRRSRGRRQAPRRRPVGGQRDQFAAEYRRLVVFADTDHANNRVEADHGRLKARLRPMRGLTQDRNTKVIVAGHAFVQTFDGAITSWRLTSRRPGGWPLRSRSWPWRSDPGPRSGSDMPRADQTQHRRFESTQVASETSAEASHYRATIERARSSEDTCRSFRTPRADDLRWPAARPAAGVQPLPYPGGRPVPQPPPAGHRRPVAKLLGTPVPAGPAGQHEQAPVQAVRL
jgi:hypothetical protein